jgi:adenosylmethionine---8-amino-7-oxononanoate aminotransferase
MLLSELDGKHVWHPFTQMAEWQPLVIERGEGNYIFDTEGRKYFDGVSSLWCNVHGHAHPRLNKALMEQASKMAHSTFLGLSHEPGILLAKELLEVAPKNLARVFFSDSGSTAVEIALKQSFQYWQLTGSPQKTKFVRLNNAYHGDTLGAVAVGGIDLFHKVFGPLLMQSIAIRSPYEPPWSGDFHRASELTLAELDRVLERDDVAALVMEPLIQGAAGMLTHPTGFLAAAAARCRSAGVHLIIDEVATGFGRTGRMFACDAQRVEPDFLCLAKGISGGYLPLAATLSTETIYQAFLGVKSDMKHFFHGHTYTANALACAVGRESLAMLREQTAKTETLAALVTATAQKLVGGEHIREVRTCGAMVGIELGSGNEALPWDRFTGAKVCDLARKHGVMLRPLGDVIVWIPPLSSSESDIQLLEFATQQAIKECFT